MRVLNVPRVHLESISIASLSHVIPVALGKLTWTSILPRHAKYAHPGGSLITNLRLSALRVERECILPGNHRHLQAETLVAESFMSQVC
jgi:hypothetical protein